MTTSPFSSPDFLPFGSQYYRAPTPPPEDWAGDLDQFAEQGFNTIKIWAQWRWNNPREGVYDFSDMQHLLDLAQARDLAVIINLIYDVAPAWYWRKFPDAVMLRNDGGRIEPRAYGCRQIGGAPGPSYHHPEGQDIRREFTAAAGKALGGHPALYVWDLWNEPELTSLAAREVHVDNLADYSTHAQSAFKVWLETRYQTLDALNHAWGRNYQVWDEVEVPRTPDTFRDMIDWRLFFVDTLVEELNLRAQAIRSADTETPVMVHTVPIPYFNAVTCSSDEYKLAAPCDWFGNSVGSEPFPAALTVSAAPGKKVINAEIHAISGNTSNRPIIPSEDEMRRHILVPLARGVQGFLFWQYRPERFGLESPAWGLTDGAGQSTPWLESTRRINAALQADAASLLAARPSQPDVAIINSTSNQIFDWCISGGIDRHYKSVRGVFQAFYHHQLNSAVIGTDYLLEQDLSSFKVIYYPNPYYMDEAVAARLRDYVAAGGTLIAECFFAGVTGAQGWHSPELPGLGFDAVFGVRETRVLTTNTLAHAYGRDGKAPRGDLFIPFTQTVDLPLSAPGEQLTGFYYSQGLEAHNAEVLATFEDGSVAVSRATYGDGQAICLGTLAGHTYAEVENETTGRFLAGLALMGGARPVITSSTTRVRADLLAGPGGGGYVVVINDRSEPVRVNLGLPDELGAATATDLLGSDTWEIRDNQLEMSLRPRGCDLLKLT